MAEIVWSPQAIEDVASIRDFIGRDAPTYAALVAARLVDSVERLAQLPESGRVVPECQDPGPQRFFGGIIGLCIARHVV